MWILRPSLAISCCYCWKGDQFSLQQSEGQGEEGGVGLQMGLFIVRRSSGREEKVFFTWMCGLQRYILDACSECDRLFWRVYYGVHCIRDLLFTYLCVNLVAEWIDTRMCQEGAENICSKGQNYSLNKDKWSEVLEWKCMSWFPTHIGCIKSVEPMLLLSFQFRGHDLAIFWMVLLQFCSPSTFLCIHFARKKDAWALRELQSAWIDPKMTHCEWRLQAASWSAFVAVYV